MAETENRDLGLPKGRLESSLYHTHYSNSYAILIGIDTYRHPRLRPLGKAEEDARSFADVLSTKPYNFQVELLLGKDATRSAITQALNKIIKVSQPDDRVIFYFAGHGYIQLDNRGFDAGYLACADTDPDDPFDGLEYDEVKKITRYAKAKHIAFILDACFSGSALGLTRATVQPAAVQEYLLHNAYQVLTAGGFEVVSDARSMTGELVKAFKEGFPGEEPPFTFNQLGQHVQDVIHNQSLGRQTPIYGFLEGSSKGQMVLVTPTPLDSLPEELRKGLTDQIPLVRRLAILASEKQLADPVIGTKVRLALEKMQVDDEDREVRRRAAEALRSLVQAPEKEISLKDEKKIQGAKKQLEAEILHQPSSGKPLSGEKVLPERQSITRKKPDWRWIAGITGAAVILFILTWMGWKIWGPQTPQRTAIVDLATWAAMTRKVEENLKSTDAMQLAIAKTATAEKTATVYVEENVTAKAETAIALSRTSTPSVLIVMETANAAVESVATDTSLPDPSIPPACTETGQTWTSPFDGMTLVCVPAGEFSMGSEDVPVDEKPVHTVYLDAFWIDKTEVTNGMYAHFVAETGHPNAGSSGSSTSDHPVTDVSWNDAEAYCQWAQRQLPSEAQWEKAGRGTDGRTYPWGNQDPNCTLANSINDATENLCVGTTTSVGSYPGGASPYGALDMAGNVWEWVADWYQGDYYSSSPESNPTGSTSGDYRVLRGGGWGIGWYALRTSNRHYSTPDVRDSSVGFRCGVLPGK